MNSIKWLYLLLEISSIGSLRLWKPVETSKEEAVTKKILETCYENNDFNDLIFILGDFNEFINKASVIRMKNLLNVDEDSKSHQFSSVGVTKVLVIVHSPKELHSDLISLKETIWWNHMLPFFIIAKNNERCENVKEILKTTWTMDIINSIYICTDSENTILYTLNPIANYAPAPWKRLNDLNDSNIFYQIISPRDELLSNRSLDNSCENLNYDKIKILNGYEIAAIAINKETKQYPNVEAYIAAISEEPMGRLFQSVIRRLNASAKYEESPNEDDVWKRLKNGHSDMLFNTNPLEKFPQYSSLFPHTRSEVVAVVKSKIKTPLYKICHLWSTQVLIAAAITLIILLFIFTIHHDFTLAMLDVIRFLTYVSIQRDNRTNSFRIYFSTMLIFIVISNGVFQGKIATFLTKPEKIRPIENFDKLIDLKYQFYTDFYQNLSHLLPDNSEIKQVTSDECINYVLNSTRTACLSRLHIYEKYYMLKPLENVGKQVIYNVLQNYKTRRNWVLRDRVNDLIIRFIQFGFYRKWAEDYSYDTLYKRKADEAALAREDFRPLYRPIKLDELMFAFKLLAFGLSLAAFAFFLELRM